MVKKTIYRLGPDNNIRRKHMQAVIRKRQQRRYGMCDKQRVGFRVRGIVLEPRKIDQWMRNYEIPNDRLYDPSSPEPTPSVISCWTLSDRNSSTSTSILPGRSRLMRSSYPAQNAQPPSPAFILKSTSQSSGVSFTGKSPSAMYRSLPSLTGIPATYICTTHHPSFQSSITEQTQQSEVVRIPYRYRQKDEVRLRQELQSVEMQDGVVHPAIFPILKSLGKVLQQQGRYKSAEEIFRRLVSTSQGRYGVAHITTLAALSNLGDLFALQELLPESENLLRRNLKSLTVLYGLEHEETLACMSRLALTCLDLGQWKEAEKLLIAVVEKRKSVGSSLPSTLFSMRKLAEVFRQQGRLQEAERLLRQVIHAQRNELGPHHLETMASTHAIARIWFQQQCYEEAEVSQLQVFKIREATLGPEHPETLSIMHVLSLTWKAQARHEDATEQLTRCGQLKQKILGAEHPMTKRTYEILAQWEWERLHSLW